MKNSISKFNDPTPPFLAPALLRTKCPDYASASALGCLGTRLKKRECGRSSGKCYKLAHLGILMSSFKVELQAMA